RIDDHDLPVGRQRALHAVHEDGASGARTEDEEPFHAKAPSARREPATNTKDLAIPTCKRFGWAQRLRDGDRARATAGMRAPTRPLPGGESAGCRAVAQRTGGA